MRFLPLLLIILASCNSRHIQRSHTTTDSTTSTTTHVQAADINKSTAVTRTTVSDQSGQKVVFDRGTVGDTHESDSLEVNGGLRVDSVVWIGKFVKSYLPNNTVTFENGRIQSASGNILEATATSTHLQEQNDSLYTENMILKDSLQMVMSAKHVETVTVEKVVKRTPIGWWLLALVVGFIGGVYCQYKKPLI